MADDSKIKSARPEARLPKGFRDVTGAEIRAQSRMLQTLARVFETYGYEPLETSAIEYTEALGKFLPDTDRPNAGVFSFQDEDADDKGGAWMSLRYDMTAPLARFYAENQQKLPKPYRRYAMGPVWRNEKPGPGRFRQFMQCDADTVGTDNIASDAEACMLMADAIEALGVPKDKFVIRVNNRKILDGLMEAIGLSTEADAGRRLTVMRALDKFDKFGHEGVRLLLGAGRKDESGDFTKGAGLSEPQIATIITIFGNQPSPNKHLQTDDSGRAQVKAYIGPAFWLGAPKVDNLKTLDFMSSILPINTTFQKGIEELRQIATLANASGYDSSRIVIDPSVVRGLDYYTGPVFEAELQVPDLPERGGGVPEWKP